MAEVAKHAGVGIGTVSRVLSGSPKVSDTTRTKVQASAEHSATAAREKLAAEQGKGGRLIGVLVPFFDEKSSFQRIRGIVSRLAPHGCEVVLHNIESPAQARAKFVELPRSPIFDGLIIISLAAGRRRRRPSRQRQVPDRAGRHVVPRPAERVHRRP